VIALNALSAGFVMVSGDHSPSSSSSQPSGLTALGSGISLVRKAPMTEASLSSRKRSNSSTEVSSRASPAGGGGASSSSPP